MLKLYEAWSYMSRKSCGVKCVHYGFNSCIFVEDDVLWTGKEVVKSIRSIPIYMTIVSAKPGSGFYG